MKPACLLLCLFALLLLAACGTPRRGEPFGWVVTDENAHLVRGEAVFQKHCHQCHPGGEGGLGPSLNEKPLPAWLMRTQVRAGLGVMPSFDEHRISDDDLDALADYLVALRRAR